jgi:hypothetical protein
MPAAMRAASLGLHRAEVLDDGRKRLAVDVLHDDEVTALGVADVEDLDDVGVLHAARRWWPRA